MTSYRTAVRSLLRDRLLDAAYNLVAAKGWSGLRMTAVAPAAGVSRQTVYNEFPSKEALGQALVQREAERFLAGITRRLDAHPDDLFAAAEEAVEFALLNAERNPLIRTVLTGSATTPDGLLSYLTVHADPVFAAASAMLDDYLANRWPNLDHDARTVAVDAVVRLTVSHIVQSGLPPHEAAHNIALVFTRAAGHR